MAIRLSRIGHVALRVRDLQRAKKFYTEVMGFKVAEEYPEHGNDVFMSLGHDDHNDGHTFDLVQVEDPQTASPPPDRNGVGYAHIAIKVDTHDNLKEAHDHLVQQVEALGYKWSSEVLNSANFGVPQIRERFLMLGALDAPVPFPARTHAGRKFQQYHTGIHIFL